jgi:hypothetical protein
MSYGIKGYYVKINANSVASSIFSKNALFKHLGKNQMEKNNFFFKWYWGLNSGPSS